jgi:[ribosomal protein S5]-alanine N-acetyltransferase
MLVFPLLHTKRLTLRKIAIDDIPALLKYGNNENISKYVLNIPFPYREPDAVFRISYVVRGFNEKSRFVFSIVLKETDELIGEISLHLHPDKNDSEMGYWLGEPLWNKGLMSEAIEAVVKFGFEKLDLELIYGECHAENIASKSAGKKSICSKSS